MNRSTQLARQLCSEEEKLDATDPVTHLTKDAVSSDQTGRQLAKGRDITYLSQQVDV